MPMLPAPRLSLLFVVPAVALAAAGCSKFASSKPPAFKLAEVTRGDLVQSIDATGVLQPEDVVDIGAQVTGQIVAFGADTQGGPMDYGSQVTEGQVLARIDDAPYALALRQAEAQKALAEANVQVAEGNHERDLAAVAQNEARVEQSKALEAQARAQLEQARLNWERAQQLGPGASLSKLDYDNYRTLFEAAVANVSSLAAATKAADEACGVARAQAKSTQAAIAQAKAGVTQAEVAIELAKRNLGYCTIKAPVTGIVIDRRVDVGQTVVSNLNASSLFLLAKDLGRMQVWASVNEASIGSIRVGQPVSFTTDVDPLHPTKGRVERVRLNATMTQNVVTYTVEIAFDNADRRLLPYLTANVKFEVERRNGVLRVPAAALRWKPAKEQMVPGAQAPPPAKGEGVVWVPEGERVRPVPVKIGLANGALTEVTPLDAGAQLEGASVVAGVAPAGDAGGGATNPFAPQQRRPGGGSGQGGAPGGGASPGGGRRP